MIKKLFINLAFFYFILTNVLLGEIQNKIVVKVNNDIITNIDIQNEIKTLLLINQKPINQKNIDQSKDIAIKSLIRKLIKKNEIKKFNITKYSKEDINVYLSNISKKNNTNINGLKKIFLEKNANYNVFVEGLQIELLWNTLIYSIYSNQLEVNPYEIENELEMRTNKSVIAEYKLSEIELSLNNEKIEEIYKLIKSEGFKKAVKKFSISNSSNMGGDIGWISKNDLSNIYINELAKFKLGDVTTPIKNENSIVILKIDDIKKINNKNLDVQKIKEQIISNKRDEKLNLFSRSHFSSLENSTLINFK
ncbi:MAG: peptidylprolyl isomerase [Pelagibacteraceae bacterium]